MKISILTLFPNMFEGFLNESIIKRAIEKEKVQIVLSGVNERVRHTLEKAGFTKILQQEFICSNINEALEKARQLVTK